MVKLTYFRQIPLFKYLSVCFIISCQIMVLKYSTKCQCCICIIKEKHIHATHHTGFRNQNALLYKTTNLNNNSVRWTTISLATTLEAKARICWLNLNKNLYINTVHITSPTRPWQSVVMCLYKCGMAGTMHEYNIRLTAYSILILWMYFDNVKLHLILIYATHHIYNK